MAAFLSLYVVVAAAGELWAPRLEVFPFFSWALFVQVPNVRTVVRVEVVELDGVPVTPGRDIRRMPGFDHVASRHGAVWGYLPGRADSFLRRWYDGRDQALERAFLEEAFAAHRSARVQIVSLRYDALDYGRDGRWLERVVLRELLHERAPR